MLTRRKMKRDWQRWLDHVREHGTARGMTLGHGKPHDRRVLQALIDAYWIKPVMCRVDPLQDDYAVRGEEDKHGLALLVHEPTSTVLGATHYSVRVRLFDAADYERDAEGSCLQNGIDTSYECYPGTEYCARREWMQWAIARSTLASYD